MATSRDNSQISSCQIDGDTELELADISPAPTSITAKGFESNVSLLTDTSFTPPVNMNTNTSRNSYSGAGLDIGNASNYNTGSSTKEVIQPLTASTSDSNSSSVSPVLIVPKNRRRPESSSDGTNKVTMTGTILQGSGGGTPVEVEVELSGRELERLTSARESCGDNEKRQPCGCGRVRGPHIVMLSFMSIPVAFLISLGLSFHNISITWYNLFIYLSEEKSVVHRLTLCPLLVLSFPITVGLSTLLLSVAASFIQISWSWNRWISEILDGEKGFCGWLCNKLSLPDCSPYQLVILDDDSVPVF